MAIGEQNATDFPHRLFFFWLCCPIRFILDFTGPCSPSAQMLVFPDTGYGEGETAHTKPDRGSHMADGALMNQRVLICDVSLETHGCPFPSGLTLLKTLIYRATALIPPQMRKANSHLPFFPHLPFSSVQRVCCTGGTMGGAGRERMSSVPKTSELPT